MNVIKKRKEQVSAAPVQAAQEGEDEPPDPNPCLAHGAPLSIAKPAGRIVRFPAQRTGNPHPVVKSFRKKHFPAVPTKLWNDWQWQTSHRIRSLAQLETMIVLSDEERAAFARPDTALPLGITPYYMSLVSPDDPHQPIRRSVIPTVYETAAFPGEADDPLGEEAKARSPVWCIATRTGCCCCSRISVPPTAATVRGPAWWATAASIPAAAAWNALLRTSSRHRPFETCCSPAGTP